MAGMIACILRTLYNDKQRMDAQRMFSEWRNEWQVRECMPRGDLTRPQVQGNIRERAGWMGAIRCRQEGSIRKAVLEAASLCSGRHVRGLGEVVGCFLLTLFIYGESEKNLSLTSVSSTFLLCDLSTLFTISEMPFPPSAQ